MGFTFATSFGADAAGNQAAQERSSQHSMYTKMQDGMYLNNEHTSYTLPNLNEKDVFSPNTGSSPINQSYGHISNIQARPFGRKMVPFAVVSGSHGVNSPQRRQDWLKP